MACLVLAAACLAIGLLALRTLRRRLELVARAEHELRGPATALELACQRMSRDPAASRHAEVLEAQLERLRAGLDDLGVARRGGRAAREASSPVELASFVQATVAPWRAKLRRCSVEWRAGRATAVTDRGRLAQALGNLVANAAEHGAGDLSLRAGRVPGAVRVELRNGNRSDPGGAPGTQRQRLFAGPRERGHGLAIAAAAARDLGGRLLVRSDGAATVAVLELPENPPPRVQRGAAGPPPAPVAPGVARPPAAAGPPDTAESRGAAEPRATPRSSAALPPAAVGSEVAAADADVAADDAERDFVR
ncbi:MAG: HAMP domain-containing histidine kinase [Thermoleophilaceae bacterium]|nr:HAMP domain-containing histidine kinase [Thermoleophilaceae bacterium]